MAPVPPAVPDQLRRVGEGAGRRREPGPPRPAGDPSTVVLWPRILYKGAVAEPERDTQVRQEALQHLAHQEPYWDDGLVRWATLIRGFEFQGLRIPLCSMQGILKPKAMTYAPLSIRSTYTESPDQRPYEDAFDAQGNLLYEYRAGAVEHSDNQGLRRCMTERLPLVFLDAEEKGLYRPYFPVFVIGDDLERRSFLVDVTTGDRYLQTRAAESLSQLERRYREALTSVRIHQRRFRSRVLSAYDTTCAVCRLQRHRVLIDAAHILPDSTPGGIPSVPNALALCKLHHAAFDADLIGISPDLRVEVRRDIREEADGPMLLHGLQNLHGSPLRKLPHRRQLYPDPEFLEERFWRFRSTSV